MSTHYLKEGVVAVSQDDESARHYRKELRMRLDKLSRTYDLTTMKIFMTVEALGENNVYSTYSSDHRGSWETFLIRREACRLDLTRHEKTRERYLQFLSSVPREQQGQQFFNSMVGLLLTKGALDVFEQNSNKSNTNNKKASVVASTKFQRDLEESFCGHLCRLFDKKLHSWFDAFEAVNVRLTAHVKVSNLVRVLTGQVDALCRRAGLLYAVNIKVTGMATPRPLDLMELCMAKVMVIQNGLAAPDQVVPCLLCCHLGSERPVLRLWEYRPTRAMDDAIREADIDRMIEAGRASRFAELWAGSVTPPGSDSLTARQAIYAGQRRNENDRVFNTHDQHVVTNNNSNNNNNRNKPHYSNIKDKNNVNHAGYSMRELGVKYDRVSSTRQFLHTAEA